MQKNLRRYGEALGHESKEHNRTYYEVMDPATGKPTGEVTWDPPHDAAEAWQGRGPLPFEKKKELSPVGIWAHLCRSLA